MLTFPKKLLAAVAVFAATSSVFVANAPHGTATTTGVSIVPVGVYNGNLLLVDTREAYGRASVNYGSGASANDTLSVDVHNGVATIIGALRSTFSTSYPPATRSFAPATPQCVNRLVTIFHDPGLVCTGVTGSVSIFMGAGDDGAFVSSDRPVYLDGGDGNDSLTVQYGNVTNGYRTPPNTPVTIVGGNGNDNLQLTSSRNTTVPRSTVDGGPGNDYIYVGGGNPVVHGDAGNDRIDATGTDADTVFHGDDGDDHLNAVPAAMGDNEGNYVFYGDAGNDTFDGDPPVTLLVVHDTVPPFVGHAYVEAHGGDGNDVFYGFKDTKDDHRGGDTFYGDAGDDWMSGYGGKDTLDGGSGADWIYGGGGKDTINALDGVKDHIVSCGSAPGGGDVVRADKFDPKQNCS